MAEPRKLAEGWVRYWLRPADGVPAARILLHVENDIGDAVFLEAEAPVECFAPKPLRVDDVVVPQGVPSGYREGDVAIVVRVDQDGLCHVQFHEGTDEVWVPETLTRIGHLDRASADR